MTAIALHKEKFIPTSYPGEINERKAGCSGAYSSRYERRVVEVKFGLNMAGYGWEGNKQKLEVERE